MPIDPDPTEAQENDKVRIFGEAMEALQEALNACAEMRGRPDLFEARSVALSITFLETSRMWARDSVESE